MNASEDKPRKPKLILSPFAEKAVKAMRQAGRAAAQESARYGLPLILEKKRPRTGSRRP